MENKRYIFTIGHSSHPIEYFLELLKTHGIDTVIDVRSVPASNYNPQFNKQNLLSYLKQNYINYMHFGKEFGARQEDESILDDEGIVNFELFRKTYRFQQGIERIENGILKGYSIALMCSEANPLECHRFSMISVYLEEIGITVKHILKNKSIKLHKELETELLKLFAKNIMEPSLFESAGNAKNSIKSAYELHNKQVGWHSKSYNLKVIRYD